MGILGKEFCAGLAEFGANVVVSDLDQEKAENYADKISKKYCIQSQGIKCDVTSPEEVKSMVKCVVNTFGEVNILHNNAGG